MIEFSWWEFEGKKRKLPKNLIYRKRFGLDRRYKVNKDFLNDKRWVRRCPLNEFYAKRMAKYISYADLFFGRSRGRSSGNSTIKFKRYGDLVGKNGGKHE